MKAIGSMGVAVLLAMVGVVLNGCEDRGVEADQPEIAVSSSYLQCAVQDLCGEQTAVLCLAPPGMCPGHFDISPAQVSAIGRCRVLILFDFQKSVENSLSRLEQQGLRTAIVNVPPALCVPQTYATACRQVCNVLCLVYPQRGSQYLKRLEAVEERLARLGEELRSRVRGSGAESANVLASSHQAQFVDWLGLKTVATFVGSDVETVANVDRCLRLAGGKTARFVIANKQEGTALAGALAERLGAATVVFSNFPEQGIAGADGFDRLVRSNVIALVEAAQR